MCSETDLTFVYVACLYISYDSARADTLSALTALDNLTAFVQSRESRFRDAGGVWIQGVFLVGAAVLRCVSTFQSTTEL